MTVEDMSEEAWSVSRGVMGVAGRYQVVLGTPDRVVGGWTYGLVQWST